MINIADGLNALEGYVFEQAYSTFGIGTHRLLQHIERRNEPPNDGPIYVDIDPIQTNRIEDRIENAQFVGAVIGAVQDIACLVGSIAYLFGSDSKLDVTAATITAGKLALNAILAGGDLLYRSISKNRDLQLPQNT